MTTKNFLILILIATSIISQAQENAGIQIQIKSAVMAAPADMRADATVLGFNESGEFEILKRGTNDLYCLSDDPNRSGFSVACYHKDLDSFMDRGRKLRAEGKNPSEIFDIREEEVKAGKLKMPTQPTTLHILSGPDGKYNSETNEVEDAYYRYVVYVPFATSESTGLPSRPLQPGFPWLMDPGTHRAHIMITPPRPK